MGSKICLLGRRTGETQPCEGYAKGGLRAFGKGCCFQNHGFCCTPVRHLPWVPVPERDSGEWGLHEGKAWGGRGAGVAAPCGDHATRSGRERDLQRLSSVDVDSSASLNWAATRTSHGLMGVVLLALFSLNNSNSPNSQGNPLHSEPCKLRLTHTLKLYM